MHIIEIQIDLFVSPKYSFHFFLDEKFKFSNVKKTQSLDQQEEKLYFDEDKLNIA